MFDIGFTELILIAIVGLVVIGPERLPETIRTGAKWLGRTKRAFSRFRSELENEIGVDEIRRDLQLEDVMEKLEKTRQEFKHIATSDAATALTETTNTTSTTESISTTDTTKPSSITEKPNE